MFLRTLVPFLVLIAAAPAGGEDAAAGRLRGVIRTAEGRALPAATVIARRTEGPGFVGLTVTDGRGLYALDRLPPGRYAVQALAEGFLPTRLEGLVVAGPFRTVADLILRRGFAAAGPVEVAGRGSGHSLRLQAEDAQGRPLPGVHLLLQPAGLRANPLGRMTDEQGRVGPLELRPGRWRLRVVRAGWTPIIVDRLAWEAGTLEVLVRLRRLPERAVTPLEDLLPRPLWLEH